MVMRSQTKAAFRLFKKHLTRLFTIVAIVIVSIGFMSGIGEVEGKIKAAVNKYYKDYNVSDLYVKSKNAYGFTQAEQETLAQTFGEENIERGFCFETDEDDEITRVYTLDMKNNAIDRIEILDGRSPENANEIVAERATDDLKNYAVGDTVLLQGTEYVVCGVAYNPLMIIKKDEPSFQFDGEKLSRVFYMHADTLPMVNDIRIVLPERDVFDGYGKDYEEMIDGYKADIADELGADNVSVLSLYENYGMYSLVSYAEKVGLIAIVFVVFFLLVTLLIVYATMTRLFDEERAQIACMKTLGYQNARIVGKYVLFVAVGTLIGGALAFFVGLGLTDVIYIAFGMQYEMPQVAGALSVAYYLLTFGIIFVATTLLTALSGYNTVKHKPATLLIPKAPKSGKKVFLERIPLIWNRLSFKYKSTLRNVLLFKSRFFMTVVSVIGSTVLVFAGMGLLDCAALRENATSIVMVAIVLIVFSAALCALVIYNLTNINVSERTREIATLMVLGYHDNEVSGYIFREIYIMSFIGAIFGVPLGVGFIQFVFNLINFGALGDINWWTYLLTPLITMFFSFLSTVLLRKKITKTDMNASLKTVE